MNIGIFLLALRARFGVFSLVLVVTVAAAAVVSLVLPKAYRATVSLVADAKEEQSLSTVLHPLLQPRERVSYMQTQTDIIKSDKVAEKVVRDLKLADNPVARKAFEDEAGGAGSIETWLIEKLLEKLKVSTSQSSIIHVSFTSTDPHFAAAVANAFARAYIDATLELRVLPTQQAAAWFDVQLKSLRAALEDAQAKLTDYHRRKRIISADERLDVENTRLGELSAQVVKMQEQALDWGIREREARAVLEQGMPLDRLPEIVANPLIQKLKADLLQGEAKLQDLASQYGPNYPPYQRQLAENRGMREKLDAEMRKIVAGLEHSARQSRAREAELRRALAAQGDRLLSLKEDRNELTVLTRNVESAQRAYDTAHQRFVVSQVEGRASQANAAILNPALVPRKAFRPRVTLNIALSLVVGTMLGFGVVMLMELFDRRVRSRGDFDRDLSDVPLLGVINAWRPGGRGILPGRAYAAGRMLPGPD